MLAQVNLVGVQNGSPR